MKKKISDLKGRSVSSAKAKSVKGGAKASAALRTPASAKTTASAKMTASARLKAR